MADALERATSIVKIKIKLQPQTSALPPKLRTHSHCSSPNLGSPRASTTHYIHRSKNLIIIKTFLKLNELPSLQGLKESNISPYSKSEKINSCVRLIYPYNQFLLAQKKCLVKQEVD